MNTRKIIAKPPMKCDLCASSLGHHYPDETPTCYDGKTDFGPWAWMCPSCFAEHGKGLGTGKGQKYTFSIEDNAWYKEAG